MTSLGGWHQLWNPCCCNTPIAQVEGPQNNHCCWEKYHSPLQVRLVSSFTILDSTVSLHSKNNIFSFLVKSSRVKLETSCDTMACVRWKDHGALQKMNNSIGPSDNKLLWLRKTNKTQVDVYFLTVGVTLLFISPIKQVQSSPVVRTISMHVDKLVKINKKWAEAPFALKYICLFNTFNVGNKHSPDSNRESMAWWLPFCQLCQKLLAIRLRHSFHIN